VEEPVPKRIRLQSGDRRGWIAALAREHVMPLQDLVQDNAIEKPTETNTDEQTGKDQSFTL
jgi:hypothetical protein